MVSSIFRRLFGAGQAVEAGPLFGRGHGQLSARSRRLAGLGLEELQQKLRGQISTIGPDHGTQVIILVCREKEVLVPEWGEDLAPQLVQQGYLAGYAIVEFKVKPIAGAWLDPGGMQKHGITPRVRSL